MRTEQVLVTPDLAQKWLERNDVNRPLRLTRVAQYAADIEAGRFTLHHQGIAFDGDHRLRDGQHRLTAVVQTKIAVPMLVTWGVPIEGMMGIDAHAVRSAADISFFSGMPMTKEFTAAARAMMLGLGQRNQAMATRSAVIAYAQKHAQSLTTVLAWFSGVSGHHRGLRSGSPVAATARALEFTKQTDLLAHFVEVLGTGFSTFDRDRPVIMLRNQIIEGVGGSLANKRRPRMGYREMYYKTERTIQAVLENEQIAQIKMSKKAVELFPLPDDEI